ncbi:MAG: exosome complex component [Candidatus Diapherotrites archaeon]|nr:exosome complex component [Candidatus Diapherotrites archaeon]MDN5367042.1 exosome complex component [Candidatus Diapherotrites archaeon]
MFVTPGEKLAEVEEFMPSDGAYESEGIVYASSIGVPKYDEMEHEVRVESPKRIPRFNVVNSIVYGRITQTFDQYAVVELFPYNTRRFRLIPPSKYATIHVSNVRKGFVENVRNEFGVGDWIRAKIVGIQKRRFVQLSTEGANYGIIKAYCSVCRRPLSRRGAVLYCPRCKREYRRKITMDYGQPKLPR